LAILPIFDADYLKVANPSVAALYEDALVYETGSAITASGALSAYSGAKTGRSPSDKRIVEEDSSKDNVWWGPVNKPMSPDVSAHHLPFTLLRACYIS
jgi:phosphoenolpyruvate carboxykinase (ATP)